MAGELQLELLGGMHIRKGGVAVDGFVSSKAQALLCYLAVTGRPQFRASLAALLWSDLPEASARMNLRHVLANLRQLAGEHLLVTRETIAFDGTAAYSLDVTRFQAALSAAAPGDTSRLREAVGYYNGDFLAGLTVRDAPLWDEWAVAQRERLRQLALHALHELTVYHSARSEYAVALDYATRLLQLDPWREEAHRQVMMLLAESGQSSAALRQYQHCCRILEAELGVEPDTETVELAEHIAAGLIVPREPAAARQNLPPVPAPLIGRDDDLLALEGLLLQPALRLLTLLGPGGVGKTSLALELAARQRDAFESVWLVELAPVRDAEQVAALIASTLHIRESGDRPVLDTLIEHLHNKRVLLVLDNFEHLKGASNTVCRLLAGCTELRILVTSRAALNVRGEQQFHLAPLAVPRSGAAGMDLALLAETPSVALFVQCARGVRPGFVLEAENAAAVADICRRLDGLPLALELAAARIKLFAPAALRARLDHSLALLTGGAGDLPARQQTLRGVVGWSYDLLEPEQQRLFARLSVFAGGCTLEEIENVELRIEKESTVGGALPSPFPNSQFSILNSIEALVDRSLLRSVDNNGEPRFEMLETIREYAAERLSASGQEPALRRRHADTFLALAETAEPHLQRAEQRVWLDRLEREHDNLRAALDWLLRAGDAETACRMASALAEFWWPRGYLKEGHRRLSAALERADSLPNTTRAKALYHAGELTNALGDHSSALTLLEGSLQLYRELDDASGIGRVLRGMACSVVGRPEEYRAPALRAQALEQFERVGDTWGIAWMLYHCAMADGDTQRKVAQLEQSLSLARSGGFLRTAVAATLQLAGAALERGDDRHAQQLFAQALDVCDELGDRWQRALVVGGLGHVASVRGEYERAGAYFEESMALHRQGQNQSGVAAMLYRLGDIARDTGDSASAAARYKQSLAMFKAIGDIEGVAAVQHSQAQLKANRSASQCSAEHLTRRAAFRGHDELNPTFTTPG